eukprot:12887192-Ditylum_brightwellii.AAC.1
MLLEKTIKNTTKKSRAGEGKGADSKAVKKGQTNIVDKSNCNIVDTSNCNNQLAFVSVTKSSTCKSDTVDTVRGKLHQKQQVAYPKATNGGKKKRRAAASKKKVKHNQVKNSYFCGTL